MNNPRVTFKFKVSQNLNECEYLNLIAIDSPIGVYDLQEIASSVSYAVEQGNFEKGVEHKIVVELNPDPTDISDLIVSIEQLGVEQYERVSIQTDDDGHTCIIPYDLAGQFSNDLDAAIEGDDDAVDRLNFIWEKYRINDPRNEFIYVKTKN
jgi:hypothetical protein